MQSTLCVGVDVHLDDLVVRAIDKADGHEVLKRFRVTNNLPDSQTAIATLAATAAHRLCALRNRLGSHRLALAAFSSATRTECATPSFGRPAHLPQPQAGRQL